MFGVGNRRLTIDFVITIRAMVIKDQSFAIFEYPLLSSSYPQTDSITKNSLITR